MRVDACHHTVVKSPRTSTTTLNPDVSCGLRFLITCQSWLLAVTQVPRQRQGLRSGDSGGKEASGYYGNVLCFLVTFSINLKSVQKSPFIF